MEGTDADGAKHRTDSARQAHGAQRERASPSELGFDGHVLVIEIGR
jgi:hypothetical protein